MSSTISIFATTDRGLVRPANEDAAYAARTPDGAVLAVADGMGGHPGGDRASALAIAAVERLTACREAPQGCLERLWRDALKSVRGEAARDAAVASMGTTLTAALVRDGRAWLLHIGDSRAYRWHSGGDDGHPLQALTLDHSLAGEAVRTGTLDPDEAREDARRHVLTRALGPRDVEPDFVGPVELAPGDLLLLLTDGVTGVLSDDQVAATLDRRRPLRDIASALVEATHEQGAPDNVGVAALRYEA